jgi:hypothetical protein
MHGPVSVSYPRILLWYESWKNKYLASFLDLWHVKFIERSMSLGHIIMRKKKKENLLLTNSLLTKNH